MGRHGFHWLSMAALGVAILVSGRLQLGHRASGAALALEAAQARIELSDCTWKARFAPLLEWVRERADR